MIATYEMLKVYEIKNIVAFCAFLHRADIKKVGA